jgi:hypothetical protein
MPAVHEIISTLNQFAQARLPAAGWRGGSFDATRFIPAGWMRVPPAVPEAPEIAESAYAHAGAEPPLEEVLSDPVVQLIMQPIACSRPRYDACSRPFGASAVAPPRIQEPSARSKQEELSPHFPVVTNAPVGWPGAVGRGHRPSPPARRASG